MVIRVEPVRLIGSHVTLEPIAEAHVDGLFEIGQETDDWAYLPIPGFARWEDAAHWVRQALELAERRLHITFVMVHVPTGRLMGSTRYLNIRERDHGLEIGYTWVAKAHQRTAVNTEAKYLMLRHAFESLGAYRVELKTDLRNLRAQRAIERIGAQREGVLRRHMVAQADTSATRCTTASPTSTGRASGGFWRTSWAPRVERRSGAKAVRRPQKTGAFPRPPAPLA